MNGLPNSVSLGMMREVIQQKLEREEKRKAFLQDAIKVCAEYRETGLYVTSEEIDTWLEKLGTSQDVEPPKCHV